jgi:hypothetical protein
MVTLYIHRPFNPIRQGLLTGNELSFGQLPQLVQTHVFVLPLQHSHVDLLEHVNLDILQLVKVCLHIVEITGFCFRAIVSELKYALELWCLYHRVSAMSALRWGINYLVLKDVQNSLLLKLIPGSNRVEVSVLCTGKINCILLSRTQRDFQDVVERLWRVEGSHCHQL